MSDTFLLLAQAPAVAPSTTRLWISIIGLLISFSLALFAVVKYILTLKVDPLATRTDKLENSVTALQQDLLQQVVEIAEENNKHRLEQVKQTGALKLLLADKYIKKEDLEKIVEALEKNTDNVKHIPELLVSVRQMQRQWSDLNK